MQINEDELKRLAFEFVSACFAYLQDLGLIPRIPGRYLLSGRDYFYQKIYESSQYERLLDSLAEDDRVRQIYGADQAYIYSDVGKYIIRLFQRILRESDGDLSRSSFEERFAEFRLELFQEQVVRRAIWLLGKFNCKGSPFVIDAETEIRHFDYYEMKELLERDVDPCEGSILGSLHGSALVLTRSASKSWVRFSADERPNVNDKLLGLLSALRLFKPGHLYLEYAINFEVTRFPLENPQIVDYHEMFREHSHEYSLDVHDLPDFIPFWRQVEPYFYTSKDEDEFREETSNKLSEAMAVFSLAYQTTWRDTLTDLMISLETLLFDNERNDRKRKLQCRVAALIGQDDEDLHRISDDINRIYDLRSRVVHGQSMSRDEFRRELAALAGIASRFPDREEEIQAVENCKSYVRRVIRELINLVTIEGIKLDRGFLDRLDTHPNATWVNSYVNQLRAKLLKNRAPNELPHRP